MVQKRDQRVNAFSGVPAPSLRCRRHRARRRRSASAKAGGGSLGRLGDDSARLTVARVESRCSDLGNNCRGERQLSMDRGLGKVLAQYGYGSTPNYQNRHSVHCTECQDLADECLRPCERARTLPQSIDVSHFPRQCHLVEAARAEQRELASLEAADHRARRRWSLSCPRIGSDRAFRGSGSSVVFLNNHEPSTHRTSQIQYRIALKPYR